MPRILHGSFDERAYGFGSLVDLLVRPAWRFVSMYVLRAGFLDGWRGLVLAGLHAHYVFLRAAKVRERRFAR